MQLKSVTLLAIIVCSFVGIVILYSFGYLGNNFRQIRQNTDELMAMKQKIKSTPMNQQTSSVSQVPIERIVTKYETPKLDALTKALIFVANLGSSERRVYSQNKEDGVLEAIFKHIGMKSKYYVEFGVESGVQCNTRIFREKYGWKGLLMDGGYSNPAINLHKEMIFVSNIVSLFKKYNVPKTFDILSVDTDFKDFWLLQKILAAGYRPRVVIGEYNVFLGPNAALTVPVDSKETRWDGRSQYFGYSVTAGWHLGRYYGYSLVYCESVGVNCFYVIDGAEGFGKGIRLSDYINGSSVWKNSCCLPHRPDSRKRPYTTITANTKYD